ncbi:MAG TPA: ABC transporter permease [Caulobacteraceae bacterium]|jgi:putative ABC transport system permease protein
MFANVFAATLRNLARNRLYAAISIASLAVGMAATILTGLYLRDELTFDRFIPGYRNAFVVVTHLRPAGRTALVTDLTYPALAAPLKLQFPEIRYTARLDSRSMAVGRNALTTLENVAWIDPDFFRILPLPVIAGDPAAAMARPDGVVITRRMARKVFGQDAPIGQLLQLDRKLTLRVGAVLQDLPGNTHLDADVFASNLNAAAPHAPGTERPLRRGQFTFGTRVYVGVRDPADGPRLDQALQAFTAQRILLPNGLLPSGSSLSLRLVPLAGLHLYPLQGLSLPGAKPQGNPSVLAALGLIAALVLAAAAVNFVNLMTARASRRAVEVGVRKAAGATRGDLVLQFMGESILYGLIGLVLALGVVELALPGLRAALDRTLVFDYWREPRTLAALAALSLGVGALAGAYPAFVQSSFRPAVVLKGALPHTSGSMRVRTLLVALQFAVLVGLTLAVGVIAKQTHFALNDALRIDKAQMVMLDILPPSPAPRPQQCRDAFIDRVRALPGVQGAACASMPAMDTGDSPVHVSLPSGADMILTGAGLDRGFLELYGVRPLAGRFFNAAHPEDEAPARSPAEVKTVVVNQTAARALGYRSPEQAVGQALHITAYNAMAGGPAQIVGVAPDFGFDLVNHGVRPMVYFEWPSVSGVMNIKLTGRSIPETLSEIDAAWRATGAVRPPTRRFADDYVQSIYADTIRQGWLIDALCAVAVFVAALGMLGLAVFVGERRTKEIGVRKAMGATNGEVVRLLLWSFSRPMLAANLIAWPVSWWALDRWLQGFGRHIGLEPWMFLAASAAALAFAIAVTLFHTLGVARVRPALALRYE